MYVCMYVCMYGQTIHAVSKFTWMTSNSCHFTESIKLDPSTMQLLTMARMCVIAPGLLDLD